MPAKWVFHAVGPVWQGGGHDEDDCWRVAIGDVLNWHKQHQAGSIAFPAISTGVYHFPPRRAARIAIDTVREHVDESGVEVVQFVCFNAETLAIYEEFLAEDRLRRCGESSQTERINEIEETRWSM